MHFGRAQVLQDAYLHACLVSQVGRFIIRRFMTGSHYRMQIRGAPRAEGQSRGFGKKQPHAAPSYALRNEKVSCTCEIVPRRQLQSESGLLVKRIAFYDRYVTARTVLALRDCDLSPICYNYETRVRSAFPNVRVACPLCGSSTECETCGCTVMFFNRCG